MPLICLSPNGADIYRTDLPPDTVLVATLDGIIRLRRDEKGGWTAGASGLEGLHLSSLLRLPGSGRLFAGVHGSGLYRSDDNGRSWSDSLNGMPHEHVFSLCGRETADGEEIYAGTEPAHLFRSADGGDSWEEVTAVRDVPSVTDWDFPAPPFMPHVKHVSFDPEAPATMYVCIEQGALLKSVDGGQSFHELEFHDETFILNHDVHRVVFDHRAPGEIYVDGGEFISRSPDGGESWMRLATPDMRVSYPDHLYFSPDEEGVMFVAGGGTWPDKWRATGDAQSTFVISRDRGQTWRPVGGGMPDGLAGNIDAMSQVMWPGGFGFFAGTTDGEVFASLDRGAHWEQIADGIPPVSKCVHRRNLDMGRAAAVAENSSGGA